MLFSNPANHQRRLAISSSFTYSKRNNLGLHLKSRKSQKQLFCVRRGGWQYSVFSLGILEFYSFQKQLLCGVRGILLGIWLPQDNSIILHFRSSQLLCGVSGGCLWFCLFQENCRFQNSRSSCSAVLFISRDFHNYSILEVAALRCQGRLATSNDEFQIPLQFWILHRAL